MHEFKNHLLYDCVCRLTIADTHTRTHFIHIARLAMHVFCALHTQCIHTPNDKFICIYALVSSYETIKLHIFLGSKIPLKCDCQKHFNRPFIIIIFFFSRICLFASLCVQCTLVIEFMLARVRVVCIYGCSGSAFPFSPLYCAVSFVHAFKSQLNDFPA